jgi:hypothetical protein
LMRDFPHSCSCIIPPMLAQLEGFRAVSVRPERYAAAEARHALALMRR